MSVVKMLRMQHFDRNKEDLVYPVYLFHRVIQAFSFATKGKLRQKWHIHVFNDKKFHVSIEKVSYKLQNMWKKRVSMPFVFCIFSCLEATKYCVSSRSRRVIRCLLVRGPIQWLSPSAPWLCADF
jgi:hypothetical protein